ncbi:hypothetical protein PtB15_2B659 [Puccinia triticina]|nr:hypothetical protein PtB15_2B659 [Puccinia triticina]
MWMNGVDDVLMNGQNPEEPDNFHPKPSIDQPPSTIIPIRTQPSSIHTWQQDPPSTQTLADKPEFRKMHPLAPSIVMLGFGILHHPAHSGIQHLRDV